MGSIILGETVVAKEGRTSILEEDVSFEHARLYKGIPCFEWCLANGWFKTGQVAPSQGTAICNHCLRQGTDKGGLPKIAAIDEPVWT